MDTKQLIEAARSLYAGRFQAVLSTHTTEFPGYPLGSLVPYCLDRSGWPLLLLSHLAQHTRNLDSDPRCALTMIEAGAGDAQQLMRLTLIGDAEELDPEEKDSPERYFRYFPDKQDFYRDYNFRFYRVRPKKCYFVGGFSSARWLDPERILPPNPFSAGQETSIVKHINQEGAEGLRIPLPSTHAPGGACETPAQITGIDAWGVDLRQEERLYRLPLTQPVSTPKEARERLAQMRGR